MESNVGVGAGGGCECCCHRRNRGEIGEIMLLAHLAVAPTEVDGEVNALEKSPSIINRISLCFGCSVGLECFEFNFEPNTFC